MRSALSNSATFFSVWMISSRAFLLLWSYMYSYCCYLILQEHFKVQWVRWKLFLKCFENPVTFSSLKWVVLCSSIVVVILFLCISKLGLVLFELFFVLFWWFLLLLLFLQEHFKVYWACWKLENPAFQNWVLSHLSWNCGILHFLHLHTF